MVTTITALLRQKTTKQRKDCEMHKKPSGSPLSSDIPLPELKKKREGSIEESKKDFEETDQSSAFAQDRLTAMYASLSSGRSFFLHELSILKMDMQTDATDSAGDLRCRMKRKDKRRREVIRRAASIIECEPLYQLANQVKYSNATVGFSRHKMMYTVSHSRIATDSLRRFTGVVAYLSHIARFSSINS